MSSDAALDRIRSLIRTKDSHAHEMPGCDDGKVTRVFASQMLSNNTSVAVLCLSASL